MDFRRNVRRGRFIIVLWRRPACALFRYFCLRLVPPGWFHLPQPKRLKRTSVLHSVVGHFQLHRGLQGSCTACVLLFVVVAEIVRVDTVLSSSTFQQKQRAVSKRVAFNRQ